MYSIDGIDKLNMSTNYILKSRVETVFDIGKNKVLRIKANKILDLYPNNLESMPCFTIYLK